MIIPDTKDPNYYSNDTHTNMTSPPSLSSRPLSPPGKQTLPPIPPEDDAFDHHSIMSGNTQNKNLVRGASTSQRSGRSISAYSSDNRLTLVNEDPSPSYTKGREDSEVSLVDNAAGMGYSKAYNDRKYADLEYADPSAQDRAYAAGTGINPLVQDVPRNTKNNPLARFFEQGKYPLQQRIEDKKRGIGRQKTPFVVWVLTAIMVAVFIYELVSQQRAQGSLISLKPYVNPMLGPSPYVLINDGARFPPCMKSVQGAELSTRLPCLNSTSNPPDPTCPLAEICGFGLETDDTPNQWFRFITPIFLHAGFIHILLNMFAQLSITAQIEREMGSGGFFITYFAAGIFGNILGGNFSLVGSPSVGASGAIFGTIAVTWVDLFAHWKYQYRPVRKLVFMTIELAIGIAIGFIPYVDNFAHIGGFLMGLLVGTVFYPVISETKRHKGIMWAFRLAAIPLAIVLFVVLTRNFYTGDPYAACGWCRYLSCIPTSSNNQCQGTGLQSF
ncbi:hypothetical protein VNI00_001669 [Paramarasmius palmivorus]|uniref:Rhomboid-type serine protease n=1 Tax=Paramarasmius palmivorus TaxID=297713 RepID=A0AAW0E6S9_9AGAR